MPVAPITPVAPCTPSMPVSPRTPVNPCTPVVPCSPVGPIGPVIPLSTIQLQIAPGGFDTPALDRTAKLFIGGKQARPDGNYSRVIVSPAGKLVGEVGEGNRKDIRNAVAAARGAEAWGRATTHNRPSDHSPPTVTSCPRARSASIVGPPIRDSTVRDPRRMVRG